MRSRLATPAHLDLTTILAKSTSFFYNLFVFILYTPPLFVKLTKGGNEVQQHKSNPHIVDVPILFLPVLNTFSNCAPTCHIVLSECISSSRPVHTWESTYNLICVELYIFEIPVQVTITYPPFTEYYLNAPLLWTKHITPLLQNMIHVAVT